ncbi:MAG: hypothetical protein DMF72_14405 [Acidobacteria bacterium]|nr:MAG: hypothetical protein DMF72_14405 [Acidobacteriota bacterium]
MSRSRTKIITVALALFALASYISARTNENSSSAGTVISNRAEATYQDDSGAGFTTVSETVTVTIAVVAGVAVTPDETAPSNTIAPHDQVTRLFRVCNTGNNPDTFMMTALDVTAPATLAGLYFDSDNSGDFSNADAPIHLNETASPAIAPGACFGVLATLNTNDAQPQSTITITLTAQSNSGNAVNGRGQDAGTIINALGIGPRLSDLANWNIPPIKLVNNAAQTVVGAASEFSYLIAFRNSGDTAARNLVVVDHLPAGIAYVPGSLLLNDRALSDASDTDEGSAQNDQVAIRLATLKPGEGFRITFKSRLSGAVISGTGLINQASFTADNIAPLKSSTATVVVDPFGVVFAGRAGSSAPIPGARVELLRDQNGDNLLALPGDGGFTPNAKNENPFATDGAGHFSFVPNTNDVGTDSNAANYFLKITAQGYITRMIQASLRPTQAGLFALGLHSIDGQPLAIAGGFDLVREDVRINDLAAIAMNVPMFEASGLQIVKSADRARADIGDTITYRIEVNNPTAAPVNNVVIRDLLPPSFQYATGSARLTLGATIDQTIEPEIQNNELHFHLPEIAHGETARVLYRVRVGANAQQGNQENLAVASATFPSGEQIQTSPARASVYVSLGVFSTQQVIVGRVFVDMNQNGHFDGSDRPMPGVRLYLSNGASVITDSAGLYNFPSLGDGPQVVSLDPVSLPPGYALSANGRESGKTWTRLLRTPIGGGALLRQNFALTATDSLAKSLADQSVQSVADKSAAPRPSESSAVSEPSAVADRPGSSSATANEPKQLIKPGTYEVAATETIEAVAPGDVVIVSPKPNSVAMTPGLEIEVRTALNCNVKLEVNGETVSDKNIGVSRLDRKNQVSTFGFVGINVRPGANRIRATAVGPNGEVGHTVEINVMGRGPARRLNIVTDRTEIQSGGNDFTLVHVRMLDQWNNPALDGQVGIETSSGQLLRENGTKPEMSHQFARTPEKSGDAPEATSGSQLVVQTEKGEATVKLIGSGAPGEAKLKAQTGQFEANAQVHIGSEMRPTILIGFAEMSFGKGIPEVSLRNEQGNFRSRVSFFYSGKLPWNSMLTLTYDSERPINRTAGQDRMFQLDPLDRAYPLFGDSSTRFEAAPSNSKLYARIDHKRSFMMFGDFETDMDAPLAGYSRKLTGVKAHLENSRGDFVTITGARPDTSFARDVFPAGQLGIMQLSNAEILPGSETVLLETRDRRNPEIIISRETLTRSIDYNLDAANGRLFFLRYVSVFDSVLNLKQIVVTYEHRASGLASAVYTARARKNFKGIGLKLGLSAVLQREAEGSDFVLGGIDAEKTLPNGGSLQMAWARSSGEILGSGNVFTTDTNTHHDGDAYQLTLAQPLPFFNGTLKARYINASVGFFNPFGGTVTPGSQRAEASLEIKPMKNSTLQFAVIDERNKTANVDNGRLTYSAALDQILGEKVKLHFGFDHRALTDNLTDKSTDSNLLTAAIDVHATDKLNFSIKREQNLGQADPTYPTQTTIGANYQINSLTKLFFTQRLASTSIRPIGDYSGTGFATVSSRRETAIGVETRFGKFTSMTGRYQLENGISGTDSFAVLGLQNRFPINKQLSVEVGFERGFHLLGPNQSFNSGTIGFGWQPNSDFRATARYEYRDRGGVGQILSFGTAGRLADGITALSRVQWSRGSFTGRTNSSLDGMAALAIRPVKTDRYGLLFSYNHRSLFQDGLTGQLPTRDRRDTLSTDGYYEPCKDLELFGRVALNFNANGQPGLPYVSTLTYLTQARAQYHFTKRLDWAIESRMIFQPSSGTSRTSTGAEIGFWVLPDLRLGGGYNFSASHEPTESGLIPQRRGFYFTITSKLSNLFDLFGTAKAGLASSETSSPTKE